MAHEFPERAQDTEGRRQGLQEPANGRGSLSRAALRGAVLGRGSGVSGGRGGRGGSGVSGSGSGGRSSGRGVLAGGRWTLEHFLRHPTAVSAKLMKAEVVALRLYTGIVSTLTVQPTTLTIHPLHSLYTHSTLTIHSLYTHYTHCTLTVHSLYTHSIPTLHSLYTHSTKGRCSSSTIPCFAM
jgi:hypothetical protein